MDIKIEAPAHKNQASLVEYYKERLEKKFGKYKFIHAIDVKVKKIDENEYHVSLLSKPEKDRRSIFVSGKASKENLALNNAIKKMNVQIEKYKQKHYHNSHTVNKFSINGNQK